MLTIFRYHQRGCPYDSRDDQRCRCPIHVDWTSDGHRLQKSLGIRDWQAAQRRARDMEADGIEAYLSGNGNRSLTVAAAIQAFRSDVGNVVKSSTGKQYRILLSRLNDFCKQRGYVFLRQLGVIQIREFRNGWTTWSPRTSGKHIERLRRFFRWCVENDWLSESPVKLQSPRVGETDVVPFTEDEVERIQAACRAYRGTNRPRLVVLTELMLTTGLAIGDATTLSKSRIRKSHGYSVELRRTKTGVAVSCPIPNRLAKSILSLDGDTPFWSGKSDLEDITKNWRKVYARVFKAAEVSGHPHQFRHTCAKRLLVRGVPIGFVAAVLGDSEEIVRRHYSKWMAERQAGLDKAVRESWEAR